MQLIFVVLPSSTFFSPLSLIDTSRSPFLTARPEMVGKVVTIDGGNDGQYTSVGKAHVLGSTIALCIQLNTTAQ